jgi:hypothetical protein
VTAPRRAALLVVMGAAAWLFFVVARDDGRTQVSPLPYHVALALLGAAVGAGWRGNAVVTGALLAAPALASAAWVAPRGDGDGLWVLWFVTVVFAGALAAGGHAVAVAVRDGAERRRHPGT